VQNLGTEAALALRLQRWALHYKGEIVNLLRSSLALVALCSLFASSLVLADDCSESLMAESCACWSDVRAGREQVKTLGKVAPPATQSKARKSTQIKLTERPKSTFASAAAASRD